MPNIELHDFTLGENPGIVPRMSHINIVFVDDEVDDVQPRSMNAIGAFINRIGILLKGDDLSANFFVFDDPLVAREFIAQHDAKLTLVISDNNMPGISGFDMIKGLRAIGVVVPAIIRSGLPDHVPPGVITADKVVSPKALYEDHIRGIIRSQGHFDVGGQSPVIAQAAKHVT